MRFAAGRAAANRSKRPSVLDLAANAEDPTDESIVLDEIDHLGSLDSRKEIKIRSLPMGQLLFGIVIVLLSTVVIVEVGRGSVAELVGSDGRTWWQYVIGIALQAIGWIVVGTSTLETLHLSRETQMVRLTKRRLFSCLARVPLERSMLTLNSVTCQRHTTADGESRYYKVVLQFADGTQRECLESRRSQRAKVRALVIRRFAFHGAEGDSPSGKPVSVDIAGPTPMTAGGHVIESNSETEPSGEEDWVAGSGIELSSTVQNMAAATSVQEATGEDGSASPRSIKKRWSVA